MTTGGCRPSEIEEIVERRATVRRALLLAGELLRLPRGKQLAAIALRLTTNALDDRLPALESCRRIEVSAVRAAVEITVAT